ncbi:hypothetical protein SGPA1_31490 [Streptomyces misionensis JCM 4497]
MPVRAGATATATASATTRSTREGLRVRLPLGRQRGPRRPGPHRLPRRRTGDPRRRLPLHPRPDPAPPPAPHRHRRARGRPLPAGRALGRPRPAPVPRGPLGSRRRLRRGGAGAGRRRSRGAQLGGARAQLPAGRGAPGHLGRQRLRRPLPLGALHRRARHPRLPHRPGRRGRGTPRGAGHRAGVPRLVRAAAPARPRQDLRRRPGGGRGVPDVPVLLPALPHRLRRTGAGLR